MNLGLQGKVAIVTGAGRGIGREIALAFAKEGVDVVVNDIDATVAKNVAQEAILFGSKALALRADVTNPNEVNEMVKRVLSEFKRVDILVNNAGIAYVKGRPIDRPLFVDSTIEQWQKEIDIILYGTLNCTKAVIDHMIKQKSGRIVNIASVAAIDASQRLSIYGAAKNGIIAFTRNLAAEVGDHGITVNAVAPGVVETTRMAMVRAKAETDPETYQVNEEQWKSVLNLMAISRFGRPEDIAKVVVFLASDAASWITGQTLKVDGGRPILRRRV